MMKTFFRKITTKNWHI